MSHNQHTSKNILLICLWARYIWELYLNIRQYEVCKKTADVPAKLQTVMQKEDFDTARSDLITVIKKHCIENVYSLLTSTAIIASNLLAKVWSWSVQICPSDNDIILSCIWSFMLTSLSFLINLPSSIYRAFILQKKYELTSRQLGSFIIGEFEAFLAGQCLTLPLVACILYLVTYIGNWLYVLLWIALSTFTFLSLIVYPIFFAPVYDDYKPLPPGPLRIEIEELAEQLDYPLHLLYTVKDTKKLSHNTTYIYGLYGPKHIVISESLLNADNGGCSNSEILAVLSHEFGHWAFSHVVKHIILGQIYLFVLLFTYKCMISCSFVYHAVGFTNHEYPVLPGLLVVMEYILEPLNGVMTFTYNHISRCHEFEADCFVKDLGRGDSLEMALLHLNNNYTDFPVYDTMFATWYSSRPTLLERLNA